MERWQIDELYHLLRVASNSSDPAEVPAIAGIARHLLSGGEYLSLIQFSAFYGRKFLTKLVWRQIEAVKWHFDRIVDFGAGLGWLGRFLSIESTVTPCMFVDKRPWTMIDIVADLETESGRAKILECMQKGDLIVMSDLLHCLVNPKEVMAQFARWPMVILEYCPTNKDYSESYTTQIGRYGANPIIPESFEWMFPDRRVVTIDLDPYVLLLVEAKL